MGLIDFVKNAGEKLFSFGRADDKPEAQAPDLKKQRAAALRDFMSKLGFEMENLKIWIEGDNDDTAVVKGQVPNQETREKIILALGNTEGIARVDDRLDVSAPEPEAVYYTVKSGDTLSKIAKEQYGNAMKYPEIFEANKPMLKDPDKIYPGQVLRIPPLAK
jgi:nucleoid-associated protein YgaU